MTTKLVVVGSINLDYTVVVDHWPAAGETVLASTLVTALGGKGANQALAAAAAGARPVLLGAIGPDGRVAIEELRERGVDLSRVQHCTVSTGIAMITVGPDGDNSIVVAQGANALLDDVAVAQHIRELDPAVVIAQLEVPVATVLAAARVARRFVLNYSPAVEVPSELLELADPLIVNETEAAHLSATPRSLVVTLGAAGARFESRDDEGVIHAPDVDVVDTSGAGDAFAGALAAALVDGASLREAVSAGVVAGSAAVQHLGAQAPATLDT